MRGDVHIRCGGQAGEPTVSNHARALRPTQPLLCMDGPVKTLIGLSLAERC
jgi:hypothetical protein